MSTGVDQLSFFVKVESHGRSSNRDPRGVYAVDVRKERSVKHSACAALSVARDSVPFLSDNPHGFVLRVFDNKGDEIIVGQNLTTQHEEYGCFRGRSRSHPESIAN